MKEKRTTLIRVDDIPVDRSLEYKQDLPLEPLNERMDEGHDNDIYFTAAPSIDLTISRNAGGAVLKGSVHSAFTQPCGRCTDEIPRPVEISMEFILKPLPEDIEDEMDIDEDEPGVIYFRDGTIDIEDIIQETLILSMSPYFLPPKDEDGKCTVCGKVFEIEEEAEKEKGVSLGELMKKAGIGQN